MRSSWTRCLAAVLLFWVFSIPSAQALSVRSAHAPSVTRLVVFGDSNVDVGRVAAEFASGQFDDGVLPPPNTVDGRSSDGPIIPELVADRVGIPQLNFAYGGATSGAFNILGSAFPDLLRTGTLSQLDEFEARLGGAPADPHALYLIWAGSNDLLSVDKNDQAAVDVAVAGARDNLTLTVERLTALGARHIVVATRTSRPVLSDAATPSAESDPLARDDASGRQLNDAIRVLVPVLDAGLASNVLLFDDYELIREIIDGSGSNGFTAYDDSDAQFCINNADCSTLVNFDAAHKTSAVHSVLADAFIEQLDLQAFDFGAARCSAYGGVIDIVVEGSIRADTDCVIGVDGLVAGNVEARGVNVRVFGTVEGTVEQKGAGGVSVFGTVLGNVEENGPGDVLIELGPDDRIAGNVEEQGPGSVDAIVDGGIGGNVEEKGPGSLRTSGNGFIDGKTKEKGPGSCSNTLIDIGTACE